MKIRILILLSLVWTSQINAALTETDAKRLVNDFYLTLQELSLHDNYSVDNKETNKSLDLKANLLRMVLEGENFMYAPNESAYFGIKDTTKSIYFQQYFNLYSEHARAKKSHDPLLSEFDIEGCECIVPPSNKNDISTHKYYCIYVRKRIREEKFGDLVTLLDMVCVDGNAGKIVGIENRCGGYSPHEYKNNDYNSIMIYATWAYSKKMYEEAFNAYLQANWLKPEMCEPYYRIALMIYFKKGIKGRFKNKKERKERLSYYLYNVRTHYGEDNFLEIQKEASYLADIIYGGFI